MAEDFEADPLCQFTYTLNGFDTLLHLLAKKSPLASSASNALLSSAIPTEDLTFALDSTVGFEGMRHEIHNEEENEKVYQEVDKFCRRLVQAEMVS